jgi:hypothetical protein
MIYPIEIILSPQKENLELKKEDKVFSKISLYENFIKITYNSDISLEENKEEKMLSRVVILIRKEKLSCIRKITESRLVDDTIFYDHYISIMSDSEAIDLNCSYEEQKKNFEILEKYYLS